MRAQCEAAAQFAARQASAFMAQMSAVWSAVKRHIARMVRALAGACVSAMRLLTDPVVSAFVICKGRLMACGQGAVQTCSQCSTVCACPTSLSVVVCVLYRTDFPAGTLNGRGGGLGRLVSFVGGEGGEESIHRNGRAQPQRARGLTPQLLCRMLSWVCCPDIE